jgi:hypothetical protein
MSSPSSALLAAFDTIARVQADPTQVPLKGPKAAPTFVAEVQAAYEAQTGVCLNPAWLARALAEPGLHPLAASAPPIEATPTVSRWSRLFLGTRKPRPRRAPKPLFHLADRATWQAHQRRYGWRGKVGLGLAAGLLLAGQWIAQWVDPVLAAHSAVYNKVLLDPALAKTWMASADYTAWKAAGDTLIHQILLMGSLFIGGLTLLLVGAACAAHRWRLQPTAISRADQVTWQLSPSAQAYLRQRPVDIPFLRFEREHLNRLACFDGVTKLDRVCPPALEPTP